MVDGQKWLGGSSRCESLSIDNSFGVGGVLVYCTAMDSIASPCWNFGYHMAERSKVVIYLIGNGLSTLLSGGLVAGLNTGSGYNTFPLMVAMVHMDCLFKRLGGLDENVNDPVNHRYLALTTTDRILTRSPLGQFTNNDGLMAMVIAVGSGDFGILRC